MGAAIGAFHLYIPTALMNDQTVAVRSRKEGDKGAMAVADFAAELLAEVEEKRR